MTVVVADDEQLVRFSLGSMIAELDLPISIAAYATSGTELTQQLSLHRPDIAIVDIRMPGMSGLDAMAEALREFPDIGWIVLTGYSEFAYAKRAIELGASDYLTKPVAPEELGRVLTSLIESRMQLYRNRSSEYEFRLSAVLTRSAPVSAILDEREFRHVGQLIHVDSWREPEAVQAFRLELSDTLRARVVQFSGRTRRAAVVAPNRSDLAVVLSWDGEDDDAEAIARHTLGVAAKLSLARSTADCALTVVTTATATSLDQWIELLSICRRGATGRPLLGVARVHEAERLHRAVSSLPPAMLRLSALLVELGGAYAERDMLAYFKHIEELEHHMQSAGSALASVDLAPAVDFLSAATGYSSDNGVAGSARIEIQSLRARMETGAPDRRDLRSGELAQQIVSYVEANYMGNLSLADLAGHFGVTPNYLSTLFRRAQGETFVKFVTRVRMERAAELLLDRSLQIQQIARLVGYADPRHFTRIFRGYFGHAPADHRR